MSLMMDIGTAIKAKLDLKVDKVTGKGLSTEDYTTAEKTKLSGIAEGANKYILPVASSTVLGGVKAGTNITIDANGVISANDTSVAWSEITSKPTTLSGYGITDSIQSTLVSGTSIKTINGTSILGSGDISTIQTTITGNAGTATKLQTARTIGGVSFDGTANINLPGVNTVGNQNTTGNAATVTNGVYTNSSQALNTDPLRIVDNTLYLYKGDGTSDSVAVAAQKGTATVYGGAKFSLSGTTLTITTT